MSLADVLDDIASGLKDLEAALKWSVVAGGQFNMDELRRHSARMPAAFVACVALEKAVKYEGWVQVIGRFVVVLAVAARPEGQPEAQDRPRASARIAGRLVYKLVASGPKWGNDEVQAAPQQVEARNLYSKKADENNVALWAITWDQTLALKQDPPTGELDDFLELHADYQLVESTPPLDATDDIKPNG